MKHYNKEDLKWLLSQNVNFDVLCMVDNGKYYQWDIMTEGVLMAYKNGGFPIIDHKLQGEADGVNKLGYLAILFK